jgi:hypothetical protein
MPHDRLTSLLKSRKTRKLGNKRENVAAAFKPLVVERREDDERADKTIYLWAGTPTPQAARTSISGTLSSNVLGCVRTPTIDSIADCEGVEPKVRTLVGEHDTLRCRYAYNHKMVWLLPSLRDSMPS